MTRSAAPAADPAEQVVLAHLALAAAGQADMIWGQCRGPGPAGPRGLDQGRRLGLPTR
jgi:hypothetical protein